MGKLTIHPLIKEIYSTGLVHDAVGNTYKLNSSIDANEGEFIHSVISSSASIKKTLEIGCAYGLSSLYTCSALAIKPGAQHTIIDPFQHSQWHGVGVANLDRAGFHFYQLVEELSEFALPRLAQTETATFDFILIDGWHTFDHTLLDLFYANKLIKVGGYILIDDCNFSSVSKAVSYFSRYPAYTICGQSPPEKSVKRLVAKIIRNVIPKAISGFILPHNIYDHYYIRTIYSSMVGLKKIKEDERNWNWFAAF